MFMKNNYLNLDLTLCQLLGTRETRYPHFAVKRVGETTGYIDDEVNMVEMVLRLLIGENIKSLPIHHEIKTPKQELKWHAIAVFGINEFGNMECKLCHRSLILEEFKYHNGLKKSTILIEAWQESPHNFILRRVTIEAFLRNQKLPLIIPEDEQMPFSNMLVQ
tara:strand:- start:1919 stop:2407 length:489 start_codon:yes stop_codon:yes gene_type:complete